MSELISSDETILNLEASVFVIDNKLDYIKVEEELLAVKKRNYETTRLTLIETIDEEKRRIKNSSERLIFPPNQSGGNTPSVKFNVGYYNTDTIKQFSEEKFMSEFNIEIKPDEFKDEGILASSIEILRRLKQPLHKKQLASFLLAGGKRNDSQDFPESVKSSLKKHTGSNDSLIVRQGWYFLREWDLSEWGLDQEGNVLAE